MIHREVRREVPVLFMLPWPVMLICFFEERSWKPLTALHAGEQDARRSTARHV
jgi:hypothetical protein